MKKLSAILIGLLALALPAVAKPVVNITPKPAQMTVGEGTLTLTPKFKVGYDKQLPADMQTEVARFVESINYTTGLHSTAKAGKGLITIALDPTQPVEGYTLDVTPKGVTIGASNATGLFYAFQSLKKMLPANVMAGKPGAWCNVYTLPLVSIVDAPRYEYRGFMLDVSRHFFDAAQVKKMIDVMAMYKLNRFHWHLTDDQGWRLPIAKYPKLTAEGATNRNILRTDFTRQTQWRDGQDSIYGPYAYTRQEIQDVIAYAKERHIEVIPEIDMPGHMVAAIHAYPWLSTDPESALLSKVDENRRFSDFSHEIWNKGGVSWDVLDVSNPRVLQFIKDVIDEVAELFPCEYIHIGGDECDLIAWENSPACAQKLEELGLGNNYRALQSWFTKEVSDYAIQKHGKKIMAWNEIITHANTDMDMIKSIDPMVFCWYPPQQAVEVAEANAIKHVYTPFNGGYYINRSYRGFDKVGACGDGELRVSYMVNPPDHEHCVGVQGTFWTEQVDRYEDLEYLALPRLLGVAEQGWTPQEQKNYEDFMQRVNADAELLDAAGYSYGRHQL